MMTVFRCKQSGNTVSFSDIEAINSMRKEPHYEEIRGDTTVKVAIETIAGTEVIVETRYASPPKAGEEVRPGVLSLPKKRGRPVKQ